MDSITTLYEAQNTVLIMSNHVTLIVFQIKKGLQQEVKMLLCLYSKGGYRLQLHPLE